MDEKCPEHDFEELNEEACRIWNANAEWYDDRIGDGNAFQCELIEPATERLLGDISRCTIVDIACGAGRFARRMAQLGAQVIAFDFSERFIERAKSRTSPELANIEYHVLDATDKEQVIGLGANRFDGAVATMALMDMASIEPLIAALPVILKPEGWLIFSIMHPCFQSPDFCKFAELVEGNEHVALRSGVKVTKYLTPTAWKSEAILGQPELQYYFHRPLSVIFNLAFKYRFVIEGFEEPAFEEAPADGRFLRWRAMTEIPPVLVVRMRLIGATP